MLLAWRDKDRQHNPMTITDQVNLGAKASPRTSQRIVFWLFELRRLVAAQCTRLGGLFSGPRSRTTGSNDRSIDAPQFSADAPHIIQLVEQGGEDSGPSTDLAPPVEAIIDRLPRAILSGNIAPRCPRVEMPAWFKNARFRVTLGISARTLIGPALERVYATPG